MFGVSHSFSYFVFLKSIGFGFLLGAFGYFFRSLRLFGINRPFAVFLQDILFCFISAVLLFLFVFEVNAGVFRFYIFAGILMGGFVFYSVPGAAADFFIIGMTGKKENRKSLRSSEKDKTKKEKTTEKQ